MYPMPYSAYLSGTIGSSLGEVSNLASLSAATGFWLSRELSDPMDHLLPC